MQEVLPRDLFVAGLLQHDDIDVGGHRAEVAAKPRAYRQPNATSKASYRRARSIGRKLTPPHTRTSVRRAPAANATDGGALSTTLDVSTDVAVDCREDRRQGGRSQNRLQRQLFREPLLDAIVKARDNDRQRHRGILKAVEPKEAAHKSPQSLDRIDGLASLDEAPRPVQSALRENVVDRDSAPRLGSEAGAYECGVACEKAAFTAPIEQLATRSGTIPRSHNARSLPSWQAARLPPTREHEGRFDPVRARDGTPTEPATVAAFETAPSGQPRKRACAQLGVRARRR